ncbi:MAG TPA: hypothetical protein VMT03_14395 [Polyangia bacterium]|nr:hypothetical protein [Polyangia bacterium]
MKTLRLVLCGALVGAIGCGKTDNGEFSDSVPTQENVALVVPASAAGVTSGAAVGANLTVRDSAGQGLLATDYVLTATVVAVVNTATATVLTLVKDITDYPPTSVMGDTAVWGPGTDPLSANTYRLTVTRTAPHVFAYKLDGKGKNDPDTAFVTVLSGTHTQALDAAGHLMSGFGSGNFVLDFDAAATLPQHDNNVGQIAVQYSRLSPTATVTIDVAFTNVQDHCDPLTCQTSGQIFDAVYQYSATPGSGGDLQYADAKDYVTTTSAKETLEIHSRWLQTGAGRTDMQLSGGDVASAVQTSSECWDANFASVYSNTTYDQSKDWGDGSSCAFPTAAYAALTVQ